jgi:hypothetical protein
MWNTAGTVVTVSGRCHSRRRSCELRSRTAAGCTEGPHAPTTNGRGAAHFRGSGRLRRLLRPASARRGAVFRAPGRLGRSRDLAAETFASALVASEATIRQTRLPPPEHGADPDPHPGIDWRRQRSTRMVRRRRREIEHSIAAGSIADPATSPNAFAIGAICGKHASSSGAPSRRSLVMRFARTASRNGPRRSRKRKGRRSPGAVVSRRRGDRRVRGRVRSRRRRLDRAPRSRRRADVARRSCRQGGRLCHGTGGNGYAFRKLFERTGDERWLDRA